GASGSEHCDGMVKGPPRFFPRRGERTVNGPRWRLACWSRPVSSTTRPGGAFEPCGLPDPPGLRFLWPGRPRTARHRAVTWTLHPGTLRKVRRPADSGLTNTVVRRKVLAGRNPLLLLRFAGALLLRLAERTFWAVLLNEPPRNTRLLGHRPTEDVLQEQPLPQSIGIGPGSVPDPTPDALLDFFL